MPDDSEKPALNDVPVISGAAWRKKRELVGADNAQEYSETAYAVEYARYSAMKVTAACSLVLSGKLSREEREQMKDTIVFWIKSLAEHPSFSSIEDNALAFFLTFPSREIVVAAEEALEKPKHDAVDRRTLAAASVEWLDGETAICRFEHPQKDLYGTVEREFPLSDLPQGIKEGDGFELEIEVDATGRPIDYKARKDSLVKGVRDDLEKGHPESPANLEDEKAMAAYDKLLGEYSTARMAQAKGRY